MQTMPIAAKGTSALCQQTQNVMVMFVHVMSFYRVHPLIQITYSTTQHVILEIKVSKQMGSVLKDAVHLSL